MDDPAILMDDDDDDSSSASERSDGSDNADASAAVAALATAANANMAAVAHNIEEWKSARAPRRVRARGLLSSHAPRGAIIGGEVLVDEHDAAILRARAKDAPPASVFAGRATDVDEATGVEYLALPDALERRRGKDFGARDVVFLIKAAFGSLASYHASGRVHGGITPMSVRVPIDRTRADRPRLAPEAAYINGTPEPLESDAAFDGSTGAPCQDLRAEDQVGPAHASTFMYCPWTAPPEILAILSSRSDFESVSGDMDVWALSMVIMYTLRAVRAADRRTPIGPVPVQEWNGSLMRRPLTAHAYLCRAMRFQTALGGDCWRAVIGLPVQGAICPEMPTLVELIKTRTVCGLDHCLRGADEPSGFALLASHAWADNPLSVQLHLTVFTRARMARATAFDLSSWADRLLVSGAYPRDERRIQRATTVV